MSTTLVHSVNANCLNERQTVCWSQDDRIAVSAEREIIIMKLYPGGVGVGVGGAGGSFVGSEVSVKVNVSMDHLTPKADPWPDMIENLSEASRDLHRKMRLEWRFSPLVKKESQSESACWSSLQWSPLGLAPNNRTVLAGLTSDHRIVITGMSSSGRQWVQLADLLDQLVQQHRETRQEVDEQQTKTEKLSLRKKINAAVTAAYNSMLTIAAVELQWSHVMRGGEGEERCVLLFVVMRNADVVTWRISLPCTGIESCRIIDRQPAKVDGIVCSLAWTTLPENPQAGLLAVGYTDGRLETLCYSVDPTSPPDASPYRCTQVLHPGADYLPVSALAFVTLQQNTLVLLSSKEQTTCGQVVSAGCRGDKGGSGEVWRVEDGACCQVALGNIMAATGIAVNGNTVVMSAGDCVLHLAVTASSTGVEVRRVGEVAFHHEIKAWGCLDVDLSTNAALAIALFRPMFSFNHLNVDFRPPIKLHICPVRADWDSLEALMSSPRVTTVSTSITDLLALASHLLHPHPVTKETVAAVMQRLNSPPFSDTPVGWKIARHTFSELKSQCKRGDMAEEVEEALALAHRQATERLLCAQVRQVCLALQKTSSQVNNAALTPMLNWVRWSEERSEAVGSEFVGQLSGAVGQCQPDACVLCDGDVDLTEGVTVTCANGHTFGLCCYSLSVCTTVGYQCCMTCGALALSPKHLKDLPWVGEDCSRCTLCQSYLYSSTSSIRV